MMRKTLIIAAVVALSLAGIAPAPAQDARADRIARVTALIRSRMEAQRPLDLHADTITMTGDTLRLSGHVRISFEDGVVRADEAVFNQVTKRIDLGGTVRTSLGSRASGALPRPVPPTYK